MLIVHVLFSNLERRQSIYCDRVFRRDWSSELCFSRKKVVEPMSKTSLVLDMVDV